MSSVPKPRTFSVLSMPRPMNTKSSARLTPVTISGLTSGMFVSVITSRRMRPRMAWMPTRGERAQQRGQRGADEAEDDAVEQQAQRVAVAEEVEVVGEREALEFAEVLAVVEGADKEHDHRRVEEEVDDEGPDLAEAFHIVATSSSSVKRFMRPMLMNTRTMSMRLIAAPRFWLRMPLNWRSMMSPIMMSPVPPSFWEM